MNAIFCHDCRFIKQAGKIYTEASFNNEFFDRYSQYFDKLSVVARLDILNKFNISYICPQNLVENIELISVMINYKNVISVVKKAIAKSDCAIIRLPSIVGTVAVHYCHQFRKPYIIELVGCPWDALWNHSWKGKLVAPFLWRETKKCVKNAPYVVYVTSDYLQKKYPCKGNTIFCSNVVLPRFDESGLRSRLNKIKNIIENNKPIILGTTAAVNIRYKGQEYVIMAISRLNKQGYNFEYHMVGGGDNSYLKSVAERNGVINKVKFLGSVPHEKIFDYLDKIDIYVQPSKTEGLPRALIEAMSRGCPCVGSNAGGIPELLDNMVIFSSRDVKELATILASFDNEKMIKQAKRNFEFSKGYEKELIEKRRKEFFIKFMNDNNILS